MKNKGAAEFSNHSKNMKFVAAPGSSNIHLWKDFFPLHSFNLDL